MPVTVTGAENSTEIGIIVPERYVPFMREEETRTAVGAVESVAAATGPTEVLVKVLA